MMAGLFIVNCWSGNGKGFGYVKLIEKWCEKRRIKPIIFRTSEDGPDTAFNLGKKAVFRGGSGQVYLVGGDGTFCSAVNGMIASGIPLEKIPTIGLIQCGTANDFAKNMGIPENPMEAFEVIESGHTVKVDIGKLILKNEEKYFLNVVSFGFDALITEVARNLKRKYQLLPKKGSYLSAALGEIIKGMKFYRISINGHAPKEMTLVAVTNGSTYGAIFHIAPGADLQDGLLDVCCIDRVEKIKALKDIFQMVKGTHVNLPEVSTFRTSSLTLSSPDPFPCEIDGEVLPAEKEYKIEVVPKGLNFLVPPMLLVA